MNVIRYLTSNSTTHPTSTSISSAHSIPPSPDKPKVDESTTAHVFLPSSSSSSLSPDPISASLHCWTSHPLKYGIFPTLPTLSIELEGGTVEMYNFVLPTVYHYITVRPKGKEERTEKAYTFGKENGVRGASED